ncbi:MAG: gamma-glutamyltransferase [Deltaproteobacteria bacterium]|nr:gamma-glutamyltransferase [Deltaproteobacteria bacterium]
MTISKHVALSVKVLLGGFALLALWTCAASQPSQKTAPSSAQASSEDTAPEAASGFRQVKKVQSKKVMVVAANPAAAKAGLDALKKGGSALDAAVAIQSMLTLVEPQSSGIGGGAFLLFYDKNNDKLEAWDGRETAPATIDVKQFLDDEGKPIPFFDGVVSGRSVGTPGVLRMLADAHAEHGKLKFADNLEAARKKSIDGFLLSPRLSKMLFMDTFLVEDPDARELFFDDERKPKAIGTLIQNPALAKTFALLQEKGIDGFYKGPLAAEMVRRVQTHTKGKGSLTVDDLALYKSKKRDAVCIRYHSYKVCGFPPPTSGGVTPLQIMKLLEPFYLAALSANSAEYAHLLVQAERLAYADRAKYLADPDFVSVPTKELLDEKYLLERSKLIHKNAPLREINAGTPSEKHANLGIDHAIELESTTHFVVVDADGNIASMTSSVENVFGARIMVDGFLLNNQLTDFSFSPVDSEGKPVANSLEPGKRPRSSMSPLIAFHDDGSPAFAIGSPGGSRIIAFVAQAALAIMDQKLHPQDAVALPHVMNRGRQTEIESLAHVEKEMNTLSDALKDLGHDVKRGDLNSGLSAVVFTKENDGVVLQGGADPRRENTVLGDAD